MSKKLTAVERMNLFHNKKGKAPHANDEQSDSKEESKAKKKGPQKPLIWPLWLAIGLLAVLFWLKHY